MVTVSHHRYFLVDVRINFIPHRLIQTEDTTSAFGTKQPKVMTPPKISAVLNQRSSSFRRLRMNSAGIMSLNVIGHVGTRSVHLYVYNFNRKVSPSYEFIKNG